MKKSDPLENLMYTPYHQSTLEVEEHIGVPHHEYPAFVEATDDPRTVPAVGVLRGQRVERENVQRRNLELQRIWNEQQALRRRNREDQRGEPPIYQAEDPLGKQSKGSIESGEDDFKMPTPRQQKRFTAVAAPRPAAPMPPTSLMSKKQNFACAVDTVPQLMSPQRRRLLQRKARVPSTIWEGELSNVVSGNDDEDGPQGPTKARRGKRERPKRPVGAVTKPHVPKRPARTSEEDRIVEGRRMYRTRPVPSGSLAPARTVDDCTRYIGQRQDGNVARRRDKGKRSRVHGTCE